MSEEEFNALISKLNNYFTIIKTEKILPFLKEAGDLIGKVDKDDVPIIATSLAYKNCLVWSDDKHFQQQKKIKVGRTEDIIKIIEESG